MGRPKISTCKSVFKGVELNESNIPTLLKVIDVHFKNFKNA